MKLSGLSKSHKHHIITSLIIGIWLSFFLVVFAPFDASDLSFEIRLILLPPYGIISGIGYMLLIPIQNLVRKRTNDWSLTAEVGFLILYTLLCLIGTYIYYKSGIINGDYTLTEFIFGQYYPIFLIMLPIIILSRWVLFRDKERNISQAITLTGDNKLDFLTLELSELVCISSANNYIEVHYTEDNELKKKLLRNTLGHIHTSLPELIKVHRSYLVNPIHIKSWKDSKTLTLTKIEVPVSKNYKDAVLSHTHSSLKSHISPQTG